jgi:hypothetical protein
MPGERRAFILLSHSGRCSELKWPDREHLAAESRKNYSNLISS